MNFENKQVWMAPPGNSRKSPGDAVEFGGDRNNQTAVYRLRSGHLKCMTFNLAVRFSRLVPSVTYCESMRVHFWCWTLLGLMVSWISSSCRYILKDWTQQHKMSYLTTIANKDGQNKQKLSNPRMLSFRLVDYAYKK
ncbi:hypothetical protein TNCV_1022051 [Trichonephila clavipes]|nr:hypothetical protein TNCV_1022051 [Trichonephila clavipes]